jgi:hypothetical protein
MSKRELRRVGALARVASEELKLVDAAKMLSLSYRQVKRIWRLRKRRSGGTEAPQRRESIESSEAEEVSSASDEVVGEQVHGSSRRKIRTDLGE